MYLVHVIYVCVCVFYMYNGIAFFTLRVVYITVNLVHFLLMNYFSNKRKIYVEKSNSNHKDTISLHCDVAAHSLAFHASHSDAFIFTSIFSLFFFSFVSLPYLLSLSHTHTLHLSLSLLSLSPTI